MTHKGGASAHVGVGGGFLHTLATKRKLGSATEAMVFTCVTVVAFLSVVVVAQLAFPSGRAVYGVSFSGQDIGLRSSSEIASTIRQANTASVALAANEQRYDISLEGVGLGYDTDALSAALSDYPLTQRLLPFSFLFHEPELPEELLRITDPQVLAAFTADVQRSGNADPIEGTISVEGGALEVAYSTQGREYRQDDILEFFKLRARGAFLGSDELPFAVLPAQNTKAHLDQLVSAYESIPAMTLTQGDQRFDITADSIRPAISFAPDASGLVHMQADASALSMTLEPVVDALFIAPTADTVGAEVDIMQTASALAVAAEQGIAEAAVVQRSLEYSAAGAFYPQTSAGIQAIIDDWQAAHPTYKLGVVFDEIGGHERNAQLNPDDMFFSASVYKSLVAWYLLDEVDRGVRDPNDTIALGLGLEGCLTKMIIISESVCAETALYGFGGWGVLDEFIASHGIDNITLSNGVKISAGGITQFLAKLEAGELLSPESTEKLLDYMKRQNYRTGIPAGVLGDDVADKVGLSQGSWHDVGVVYDPSTTYVLSVLTIGSSLYTIADLAEQISTTLNR